MAGRRKRKGFGFEPPGGTHTLKAPEGLDAVFVMGAYVLVDPQGKAEKVEDVFGKVPLAREHCETQECPSKRPPPPGGRGPPHHHQHREEKGGRLLR